MGHESCISLFRGRDGEATSYKLSVQCFSFCHFPFITTGYMTITDDNKSTFVKPAVQLLSLPIQKDSSLFRHSHHVFGP